MTDARERRRERAEAKKRTDFAGGIKKYRVPIIIVLVWALIVGYNVAVAQGAIEPLGEDCPGHWHAGYSVWVEDQKVRFSPQGPEGDQAASPGAGFHIHADDGTMHYHPGDRCMDLEGPLAKMGVEVTGSSLTVRGQTYQENETHQVVVYHQEWEGEWREINNVGRFLDQQPGNGDRIMIAFMAKDSALGIEQRQQQTADLTGTNYEPPEGEGAGFTDKTFIGITMATIFALLAVVLWYNFAKKTW